MTANDYVVRLKDLRMADLAHVGGKNASLGEMIGSLAAAGIRVPGGFATTAEAYREFLAGNGLDRPDRRRGSQRSIPNDVAALARCGAEIRQWIVDAPVAPAAGGRRSRARTAALIAAGEASVRRALLAPRRRTCPTRRSPASRRPSSTSAACDNVLEAIRHVFASLYNDRAISYRVHQGFAHAEVALSAGVQRMVRSDLAASGVMFTLDTESGFRDVVFITASYGLGETVVQGAVNPDEFYVHKPMLAAGKPAILRRSLGSKLVKDGVRGRRRGRTVDDDRSTCPKPSAIVSRITDDEVLELARYAVAIEQHYGRPMDIEWGKDGADGKLYILQARPETVKSRSRAARSQERYRLKARSRVLVTGRAIGQKIGSGRGAPRRGRRRDGAGEGGRRARHRHDRSQLGAGDEARRGDRHQPRRAHLPRGDHRARARHSRGGRLRRRDAASWPTAQTVTVSCAEGDTGNVYEGLLEVEIATQRLDRDAAHPGEDQMNVGNPELAFEFARLPNAGVGLARLEFIINNKIGVHPKALLEHPDLPGRPEARGRGGRARLRELRARSTATKLAEGVATIAAAFWPKPVIVRLSDFKSNEYRKLLGGERYEPRRGEPDARLPRRLALHRRVVPRLLRARVRRRCKRVRDEMGLTNVELMVPFVRTLGEASEVMALLGRTAWSAARTACASS